ncbi:flagellar hook-length control protein FliK [Virgibacillus necropolis]|uniref:flagellar hook-length control protein FliK n=1 Tax=Virgibacillus necropolis TaxID=163877 RepID=UPI00384A53DC
MNITGMPIQLPMQTQAVTREKIPNELSNVFKGLLQNVKLPNATVGETGNQQKSQAPKDLLNLLASLPKELKEQLATLLKGTEENPNTLSVESKEQILTLLKEAGYIEQTIDGSSLSVDMLQQLKELLGNMTKANTNNQIIVEKAGVTPVIDTSVVPINKKEIVQQLVEISKKAESLLSGIMDQKSIVKLASEIQKLLEKWTGLEKKLNGVQVGNQTNANSTKAETVWRELVNAYQKRSQFVTTQQYNTDAKVTSSDVAKWINNALTKQSVTDPVSVNHVGSSSMPISKVEQYVIHLNQSQNTQSQGQQLVDKFQEVMKTSNFLTMKNGSTQLSIALRPANLGEMMVKLTQINGEMTVKIMVASAAARDMLESNMHQLKHMFSPQQVMIEKQEIQTQQSQNMQQEKDQQSMNSDDQSQSEHSSRDEQNQSNDDFEKQFHEILMNEKV